MLQDSRDCAGIDILSLLITTLSSSGFRVPTTFGNRGKLPGIFPVRENSGNLAFFFKNKGILMTQYFLYFDLVCLTSIQKHVEQNLVHCFRIFEWLLQEDCCSDLF